MELGTIVIAGALVYLTFRGLAKFFGWLGGAIAVDPDEQSRFDPIDQHYLGKR